MSKGRESLLSGPKVRKRIASLSSAAAGLLQSFTTSSAPIRSVPLRSSSFLSAPSVVKAFRRQGRPPLRSCLKVSFAFPPYGRARRQAEGLRERDFRYRSNLILSSPVMSVLDASPPRPARQCALFRSAIAALHKSHSLA